MRNRFLLATVAVLLLGSSPAYAQDGADPVTEAEAAPTAQPFWFGSYGRLQPSTDFDGRRGQQTRIVWPGPRVDEGNYAELEFGYGAVRNADGVEVDAIATLGFADAFFHFNRNFDSALAVRNLYAEARNLFFDDSVFWVGSRMYRGDDVYLLDFWPLDNLNTFGGGFGWRSDFTRIEWHAGVNQRMDNYQFQVVNVIDERFVGESDVVFLDRQRFITSLKAEHQIGGRDGELGMKAKLYGEFHGLPGGKYRWEQPRWEEELSRDFGWLVGAQFGMWNFMPRSFLNFFIRYAGGLAAYGEDAIPFGINDEKQALGAHNLMLALSTDIETDYVGVLVGAFARYFVDADGIDEDFDDGWDLAWSIRAMTYIGKYFTPGLEISHQMRRPNGLSPVSKTQEAANVFKVSVLPALSFGEGMYARPQLRLNYTISFLDDAAQRLFPVDDQRREQSVVHFVGLAFEWWFNSTSYGF